MIWSSEQVLFKYGSVVLGLIFFCIYGYFRYCYTYWSRKGFPYLTPRFPLGNNVVLGAEAFAYGLESESWHNAFKKMGVRFGGVWNFCNKALVITDPELIKDIMVKDFNNFMNRDFFSNTHAEPRIHHLFISESKVWKNMRQKISPGFNSLKMMQMFQSILMCSEGLVDLFGKFSEEKADIHLRPELDRFTMDNIGLVVFGSKFQCLLSEDNKFRVLADLSNIPGIKSQLSRLVSRVFPKIAKAIGVNPLDKQLIDMFENIILNAVEERRRKNVKGNDLAQLLMEIQETGEMDNTFNMNDLIGNCILFFLAGFDTSSKAIQYTLFELARKPELQEKARADIRNVLDKYNGELTYEGLHEMTYLRQVVDETLRLYPPVLTLSRICQKDYKLKGSNAIIEKGTPVVISVIGLHRDPEFFPDPEKYNPDRFSPENKSKIVPYSYLPFGEGPRNCIGRRFGLLQAMVGLIRILDHFNIELSANVTLPLHLQHGQFTLNTEDIYVRAIKMDKSN